MSDINNAEATQSANTQASGTQASSTQPAATPIEPFDPKKASAVLWKDRKHHLWFPFSFTKYRVQNDRLYKEVGLFTTTSDEILLYRIIDLSVKRTFAQKIFGTGTISVYTRMNSEKIVLLENIKHPKEVKEFLSRVVEADRVKRNVVGKEFFGGDLMGPNGAPLDLTDADGNGVPDIFEEGGAPFTLPC